MEIVMNSLIIIRDFLNLNSCLLIKLDMQIAVRMLLITRMMLQCAGM